jgi:hypothetical protein
MTTVIIYPSSGVKSIRTINPRTREIESVKWVAPDGRAIEVGTSLICSKHFTPFNYKKIQRLALN